MISTTGMWSPARARWVLAAATSASRAAAASPATRMVTTAAVADKERKTEPFEAIPAPPGGRMPAFGHYANMLWYQWKNKVPMGAEWRVFKKFHETYGRDSMLRMNMPMFNPRNEGKMVILTDPDDIQHLYRNEGKYPYRGDFFEFFRVMKQRVPEVFGTGPTGLATDDFEDWRQLRSLVQQDLMRPKSARFYTKITEQVAEDLIAIIRHKRSPDTMLYPGDMLQKLHHYTLESIGTVAIDDRFGCLAIDPDPEIVKFVDSVEKFLVVSWNLLMLPTIWRSVPNPRWDPFFRKAENIYRDILPIVIERVNKAKAKIMAQGKEVMEDHATVVDISLLEKLIISNGPKSTVPAVMAMELIFGGIDSTGNLIGFLLYNLAVNPEKQELLRDEIRERIGLDGHVTDKALGKMPYLKACIQESLRTHPIVSGNGRILPEDTVFRNYTIPKGTWVASFSELMGRNKRYFPDAEVYRPERWLRGKERQNIHPFAILPFSHGPRMCVGKRFADLEVQMATIKLLQNFRIEWADPGVKVETRLKFLHYPNVPLKFKFHDLNE